MGLVLRIEWLGEFITLQTDIGNTFSASSKQPVRLVGKQNY